MNYRDEIEIDLIDLVHVILRKWRAIIIFALIGAITLGALSYVKPTAFNNSDAPKVTVITKSEIDELRDKLEDKKKEEVLLAVNSFLISKEKYEDVLEHQRDSIKNKINAENKPNMISTYMISDYIEDTHAYMSEVTSADNIISLYSAALYSATVIQEIREATGYDVNDVYIKELYSVSKNGLSMMNLTVTAPSRTECEAIMAILEKNVSLLKTSINSVNQHTISKVSEDYYEQLDTGLRDAKKNEEQSLIDYQKSFLNIPSAFNEDQKKYYETLIDIADGRLTLGTQEVKEAAIKKAEEAMHEDDLEKQLEQNMEDSNFSDVLDSQVNTRKSLPRFISKKMVVLGGLVGAFCVMAWYGLLYVLAGTLRLSTELSDIFGLSVYGIIRSGGVKDRKKMFAFVDKFIDGLFDKNRPAFSEEESLDIVCSGIGVSARKKEAKKLFISGVGTSSMSEEYKEKIAEHLKKGNYLPEECEISSGKNVVYDPRALEKMVQSDGVVLVEQIGSSRYENIGNELDAISKYGVDVLGAVVLE